MGASVTEVSSARLAPGARDVLAVLATVLGPDRPGWLVGGTLRDALLGESAGDVDVAVPHGAIALGRALAARLDATFVVLDEGRGACRIVGGPGGVRIDLSDLRAPTLAGDLRARDFTVNALAASVHALVARGRATVEDPTGGLADLRARLVRPCGPEAMREDPLRALRGVRLGLRAGWHLDVAAEEAIRRIAPQITAVAPERLREELVEVLAEPAATSGLRTLDRLGVMEVLLPESLAMRRTEQPAPHRFDVWEHSLRAVEATDQLLGGLDGLEPWGDRLREHLAEDLGDRLTRRETLKLAALLHDVAKPDTRRIEGDRLRFIGHDVLGAQRAGEILRRLRLARRPAQVVERLVAEHLRLLHLAQAGGLTRRARFRFYRALGDEAPDLLLLTLADAAALTGDSPLDVWRGPGGRMARELMAGMVEEVAVAAAPPLLRGEDVMAALGLPPGPEVGRLLARAREAQALGLVSSREEALAYLRRADAPPP